MAADWFQVLFVQPLAIIIRLFGFRRTFKGASQVALVVRKLPANAGDIREAVLSLGWDDPLEEEMATHSSILAWRIPWTEEPGGLQSIGSQSRT